MGGDPDERSRSKTQRKADLGMVLAYHEEQLRLLLEHVREGFASLDAGETDAFELDALIHHYSLSAKELWKFCGNGEARITWAVSSLEHARHTGKLPDWWEIGDPERRRR
ncbi:MAG TPA: hypothetical protein VFN68_16370 [Acidimicrobiales bacterium]|nr:hypothetical protein [Acidimicrobiales bacterium]